MSVVIVVLTAMGSFVGALSLFAPAARAQGCDQTGSVISGDWTITDQQVCTGIMYTVDGNIDINGAGASLTLTNGGLTFTEDTSHIYALRVNGGALTLDHSFVTTEPRAIDAYLKLNLIVTGGSFTMRNGAELKFPGTFSSSANAAIRIDHSKVTGFTDDELLTWIGSPGSPGVEDNNDGPTITWDSSTVYVNESRIDRLYENPLNIVPNYARANLTLAGSTTLTAINSYIGVDFNMNEVTVHNPMVAAGTSRAFLVGVTVDIAGSGLESTWIPAFVPQGGSFFFYRWLIVGVTDASGVPVQGAGVWSLMSPFATTAFYPDNPVPTATCPGPTILSYLGKDCVAGSRLRFNVTGPDGDARIPLYTDTIDLTTFPNAQSFGNFMVTASYQTYSASRGVSFDAYPVITEASNTQTIGLAFGGLALPRPDLTPTTLTFTSPHGSTPLAGDDIEIDATVANVGVGNAATFKVRFTDSSQGASTILGELTVPGLMSGASTPLSVTWNNAAPGQHLIRVDADVTDVVPETNEANNSKSFSVPVTPLGPDLLASISFSPSPGFAENTVTVVATITNVGDANTTTTFRVGFMQGSTDATPYDVEIVNGLRNSTIVSTQWVPSVDGTYKWCVVADLDNQVSEPPPYSKANNVACQDLVVNRAPNLQVFSQDLRTSDPYPFVGETVHLLATVRNTGQAPTTQSTYVWLYIDDNLQANLTVPVLGVGASFQVSTFGATDWTIPAGAYGFHTLKAVVDPDQRIQEGSVYRLDNTVTSTVQVYPGTTTDWAFTKTVTGAMIPITSSLNITGNVTIENGGLFVSQQSEYSNRALIRISGNGQLTLKNSTIESNWPLTIYLSGTARLITTSGSVLQLDAPAGSGVLRSDGASAINLRSTTVVGQILAAGSFSSFKGVTFAGSTLDVNTLATSYIWDSAFAGVTSLQLRSDDGNVQTVDFDVRNTTFSAALTAQLHFSGHQWAQLTADTLTLPSGTTDWWTGMISQNAKVSLYWWLQVNDVDGTGTLLENANARVWVSRLDPTTLSYALVPLPGRDDLYLATNISPTSWTAPLGYVVYRANAEDRFAAPNRQWANSTYLANGDTTINAQVYTPDGPASGIVDSSMTLILRFSVLTPDFTISNVQIFFGTTESVTQPINTNLNVTALVDNTGSISVRNVTVSFFSVNVDQSPADGRMDAGKATYQARGQWIGDYVIPFLAQHTTFVANVTWFAAGTSETSQPISAVVDPPLIDPTSYGAFRELNESNNVFVKVVNLYTWPDLSLALGDVNLPQNAVVFNPTVIDVTVRNVGTNSASGATLSFFSTVGSASPVTFDLARGASVVLRLIWTPTASGATTFRLTVSTRDNIPQNTDHNPANDVVNVPATVHTQPDIELQDAEQHLPSGNITRNVPFNITARIRNVGDTEAQNFTVSVFLDGNVALLVGEISVDSVPAQGYVDDQIRLVVNAVGTHELWIYGDSRDASGAVALMRGRIIEGNEANNWANLTVTLQAPAGDIAFNALSGSPFAPGATLFVSGYVTGSSGGLRDLPMYLQLIGPAPSASVVVAVNPDASCVTQCVSDPNGYWSFNLPIPSNAADGSYTIRVNTTSASIPEKTLTIDVKTTVPWYLGTFIGLPLWIWLIIILIVVVVVVVVTVYFRVYGLGKMVECGECGSFIPEASTTCPKCGVEFEKDMAKCSNCQAWIPVDVKQCPECGVEFATGKVEMADYQEKMRMQYDEVVAKFREEAQRTLGRALNDREFQEWWRKQPTFVTFEDWLREEEEMRKMGSRPCPVCGTLNSVTATVCHKCGTYLKEEKRPPSGGAQPRRAEAPSEAAAPKETAPAEPVPKKVIRKPVTGPPVVQKKVVKRPIGEEAAQQPSEEGGGESESTESKEEEF